MKVETLISLILMLLLIIFALGMMGSIFDNLNSILPDDLFSDLPNNNSNSSNNTNNSNNSSSNEIPVEGVYLDESLIIG